MRHLTGYPLRPIPHLTTLEIRPYVTSESRHLIAALHNILSNLELTEIPGGDGESGIELKRILEQRIQELEECTIPSCAARTVKAPNNCE